MQAIAQDRHQDSLIMEMARACGSGSTVVPAGSGQVAAFPS